MYIIFTTLLSVRNANDLATQCTQLSFPFFATREFAKSVPK